MTMLQLAISGLLLGGIYALLSGGLTLVFGVLRVINFAHGEFLMLGMYLAFYAWFLWRVDPYVAVLPIAGVLFAVGLGVYWLIIKRTIGGSELTQVFSTLGLSIVLQNLALLVFGGDYRTAQSEYAQGAFRIKSLYISKGLTLSFAIAVLLTVCLSLFLNRTLLGTAIRGIAQNSLASQLVGMNVNRLYALTFAVGTASVGAAGALIAPLYSVYPRVGFDFLLIAFVIVVLGGLGSVTGVAIASALLGLVVSFSSYFLGADWAELAYFVMFVLVLALKPDGIYGKRGAAVYGT